MTPSIPNIPGGGGGGGALNIFEIGYVRPLRVQKSQ